MKEMSIYEIIAVGRWLDHEDEVISEKDVSRLQTFQKAMNSKPEGPRVTAFPYFMVLSFSAALLAGAGCMLLLTERLCPAHTLHSLLAIYVKSLWKLYGNAWENITLTKKMMQPIV